MLQYSDCIDLWYYNEITHLQMIVCTVNHQKNLEKIKSFVI